MAVGMSGLDQVMGSQMQAILQMLQQAQQLVQQKMPPPPMDPQAQVAMQVAQMEDARAKMQLQADMQLEQAKMQVESQKMQTEAGMKQQEAQTKLQLEQVRLQMEQQAEQMSQRIEMMKNDRDNEQKQMTALLANRDDNQTQIIIAQMKSELDSLRQSFPSPEQRPQQDDGMLKEMQRLLGELKEAKTNNALEAVVQGLQAVIGGQQQHQ
jgi:hypothetical protein